MCAQRRDNSPWAFTTDGAVVSSPTVAAGLVVFGTVDGFLYAVHTADGRLAWSYRTRGPVLSSPAVTDDTVVFGSMDGRLYALRQSSGELLWRTEVGAGIQGAPTITAGTVLYGDDDAHMRALALTDGSLRWEAQGSGKVVAAPVVDGDLAVFGLMGPSALRPPKLDYLVGIDLSTGEKRWALNEAYSVLSSPLVANGLVCFLRWRAMSRRPWRGVRLSDLEVIWERQMGGVVDSSPALLGAHLCLGCHDGRLYLLSADRGQVVDARRWRPGLLVARLQRRLRLCGRERWAPILPTPDRDRRQRPLTRISPGNGAAKARRSRGKHVTSHGLRRGSQPGSGTPESRRKRGGWSPAGRWCPPGRWIRRSGM